uniref:Uncharacterized protein n=1 Tax=Setaria viridis TaxID=4556 RepID=A0A4V6D357_SETVI|nr:hypothetical protein SEVIR_8G172432v2 [Setaria viridis]
MLYKEDGRSNGAAPARWLRSVRGACAWQVQLAAHHLYRPLLRAHPQRILAISLLHKRWGISTSLDSVTPQVAHAWLRYKHLTVAALIARLACFFFLPQNMLENGTMFTQ